MQGHRAIDESAESSEAIWLHCMVRQRSLKASKLFGQCLVVSPHKHLKSDDAWSMETRLMTACRRSAEISRR
jgi:hypothetical protein